MHPKDQRLKAANSLIAFIALCGCYFFRHGNLVSEFRFGLSGRIWFWDSCYQKEIYTPEKCRWKHFSEALTLEHLVRDLCKFIRTGKTIDPRHFGQPTEWETVEDPWGYGPDMEKVREKAWQLNIIDH